MAINITTKELDLATIIDSPDSNTTYIGDAKIGSAKTDAVWQIMKIVKSGTEVEVQLANGNLRYNSIWNDRTSLVYRL